MGAQCCADRAVAVHAIWVAELANKVYIASRGVARTVKSICGDGPRVA